MKYEDLKCEHCNGQGEKEVNRDGADVPVTCIFCDGSGIDTDQLNSLIKIQCSCIHCGYSFDEHSPAGFCPWLHNGSLYSWLETKFTPDSL